MLKKWHLWTGILFFVVFLLSGVYMKINFPGIYGDNQLIRMMYRANHIYLLLASLINIVFGIFLNKDANGKILPKIASYLLLLSPFLLLVAFIYEPPQMDFNRSLTFFGILSILLAVLLQVFTIWLEKRIK